jgi:hypothetical protein
LFSYDILSKKPLLFKSFTGLTVKEFDNIYDKEIIKRYEVYMSYYSGGYQQKAKILEKDK